MPFHLTCPQSPIASLCFVALTSSVFRWGPERSQIFLKCHLSQDSAVQLLRCLQLWHRLGVTFSLHTVRGWPVAIVTFRYSLGALLCHGTGICVKKQMWWCGCGAEDGYRKHPQEWIGEPSRSFKSSTVFIFEMFTSGKWALNPQLNGRYSM